MGKAYEQNFPVEKTFPIFFRNIYVSARRYSRYFFVILYSKMGITPIILIANS